MYTNIFFYIFFTIVGIVSYLMTHIFITNNDPTTTFILLSITVLCFVILFLLSFPINSIGNIISLGSS